MSNIELLSEEIRAIAQGVRRLMKDTQLKEKTIILLIRESIPVGSRPTIAEVKAVLTAAENLEKEYLK